MPFIDEKLPKCVPWAFRDLSMEYGKEDAVDRGIAREIKEDTGARLNESVRGLYEDADTKQPAIVFFRQ
jgi:hypothetical protein